MSAGKQKAILPESNSISWERSSFGSSSEDTASDHAAPREADFVAVVNTISEAYQRNRYLKMRHLNNVEWDELGQGAHFQVSRSKLSFEVVSATTQAVTERVLDHFVIKRTRGNPERVMTPMENAKFVRELRILDHLHGHTEIVTLKGIAWFYEHDDDLRPCPKPVFLLEKASVTLDSLVRSAEKLDTDAAIAIFADVAIGLETLHRAGIVHGDLKPDNVLLFPNFYHADRTYEGFSAKLSDFSNALLKPSVGERIYYTGGTSGYIAPELPGRLTWEGLKLTDLWSLGILFSVVVSQSFEFRDQARSSAHIDTFILVAWESFRQHIENSAMRLEQARVMHKLFEFTLQKEPLKRDLDRLVSSLREYTHKQDNDNSVEMLQDHRENCITISYYHFKSLSGSIKTMLVESLQAISGIERDPRRAAAFFELATMALSKYETPLISTRKGLEYLQCSVEIESPFDPRPRALYGRIHDAFSTGVHLDHSSGQIEDWLFDAALQGHKSAFEDLLRKSPSRAKLAWKSRARDEIGLDYYGAEDNMDEFEAWIQRKIGRCGTADQVRTASGIGVLHWAAATGQNNIINTLYHEHGISLDLQTRTGDTALLVAASYGQWHSIMTLLDLGADASIVNNFGENILHYLWCFSYYDAQSVASNVIGDRTLLAQEARERPFDGRLDVSPLVSGTPLERLAARNRSDLVELLIFVFETTIGHYRNGNETRRMLKLAMRLHNPRIQEILVVYAEHGPGELDPTLQPLHLTEDASFVCDAAAGWTSGIKRGIDAPFGFVVACRHGIDWRETLESSFVNALQLFPDEHSREEQVSNALLLSFNESNITAFKMLLKMKLHLTAVCGFTRNRPQSIESMTWKTSIIDKDCFMEMPVTTVNYIDQLFYDKETGTLAQRAMLKGDRAMFHLLVHTYKANMTLPVPFPSRLPKTFTRKYTERPSPRPPNQANGYSFLAYAEHRDLWFVYHLRKIGIRSTHPFRSAPYSGKSTDDRKLVNGRLYMPPLFHALYMRFWGLALFLLKFDSTASLTEMTSPYTTVLDLSMSLGVIHPDIIHFLFGSITSNLLKNDLPRGGSFVPLKFRTNGGYHVFRLVHDCLTAQGAFGIIRPYIRDMEHMHPYLMSIAMLKLGGESEDTLQAMCKDIDAAWTCLLDLFPDVENAPTARVLGFIPYKQMSILEQSFRLHAILPVYTDKLLTLIPFARTIFMELPPDYAGFLTLNKTVQVFSDTQHRRTGFPCQTFLEFLCGSPLDLMVPKSMAKSGLGRQGWSTSLWQPSYLGVLITLSILGVTIYSFVVRPFFWWSIIPNFLTLLIWTVCTMLFSLYAASWVVSSWPSDYFLTFDLSRFRHWLARKQLLLRKETQVPDRFVRMWEFLEERGMV